MGDGMLSQEEIDSLLPKPTLAEMEIDRAEIARGVEQGGILNEDEIHQLLSSIQSGDVEPEDQPRNYDRRRVRMLDFRSMPFLTSPQQQKIKLWTYEFFDEFKKELAPRTKQLVLNSSEVFTGEKADSLQRMFLHSASMFFEVSFGDKFRFFVETENSEMDAVGFDPSILVSSLLTPIRNTMGKALRFFADFKAVNISPTQLSNSVANDIRNDATMLIIEMHILASSSDGENNSFSLKFYMEKKDALMFMEYLYVRDHRAEWEVPVDFTFMVAHTLPYNFLSYAKDLPKIRVGKILKMERT
jgi:hypothetical protein